MHRILVFLIIIFSSISVHSEKQSFKLYWDESVFKSKQFSLTFPSLREGIKIDETIVTYWFNSFEIISANVKLELSDTIYELAENIVKPELFNVKNDLLISSEVVKSGKNHFLNVIINPFKVENGLLYKLKELSVKITEQPEVLKSASLSQQWKTSSVLNSGKWVKVKTKSRGIHKITFDQLKLWGFQNPDLVSLYGTGGYMMPIINKNLPMDDLEYVAFWKGKDGTGKDCMFFYSSGNTLVKFNKESGLFSHSQNSYSTETYFFLSEKGSPKLVSKAAEITAAPGRKLNSFQNYFFYEKESVNLLLSGSMWLGEKFSSNASNIFNITIDNPDFTASAVLSFAVAGKASAASSMDISLNNKNIGKIQFKLVDNSDPVANYADRVINSVNEILPSKNLQLKLTYNGANSSSEAWLDYFSINYKSLLNILSDSYLFYGQGSDGGVLVTEFSLNGAATNTRIWDVTDLNNNFEITGSYLDGQYKFKSDSETIREYVAFNPGGNLPSAEFVGNIQNQNLHGEDNSEFIIVTHSKFLKEANELANLHRDIDKMTVKVVTPETVYNEFSGGHPDAAGLRNYFRMCYDRGLQTGKIPLKYILLFGDGSFDNRNILTENRNLIPTFQSDNSLSPVESFVSDDFFAFLDENESVYSGSIDVGIGRIPSHSVEEASYYLNKIKNYNKPVSMGNWRNVVTFIGDDEDNAIHMWQADNLAEYVNKNYPEFYTEKIYFDAFKQISTPVGKRYPDVTSAINNRVKNGTLIMNYTGHANSRVIADENVVDVGVINSWNNFNRLPVFMTATCEFGRFDDRESSAGEHYMFNPVGGGIGLFSTTRLVYSGANYVLNRNFYRYVFEKDNAGNQLRLGDVMRLAKAVSNTGINQLNFSLLGDPALKLAFPNLKVKTSSINGKDLTIISDTINNLSKVTVKGFIADHKGVKQLNFNGEIVPTVYDKSMNVSTLGNSGQDKLDYKVQNNIIHKGLASVKNGEFEFSFIVPKDISFKIDKGKIMYYAYNETIDAQGVFDNFYIGGSSKTVISDNEGPVINLFMNNNSFKNGGKVSASSILLADISDVSGINTSGVGIGHDITAVLNGDYSNIMILNNYFQSDKDSYTSGKIVFPLNNLPEGEHIIVVKVWDVLNNSSEKEIRFVVRDDFRIDNVNAFPNPMNYESNFVFTHNQPDENLDLVFEVFNVNGQRVDLVRTNVGSVGTESIPFKWVPGERNINLSQGVYIYRMTLTTSDGKQNSGSGRLVYVYH